MNISNFFHKKNLYLLAKPHNRHHHAMQGQPRLALGNALNDGLNTPSGRALSRPHLSEAEFKA